MLLKKRTQLFCASSYTLVLLDTTYRKLQRVSDAVVRIAHLSIARMNTSARTNAVVPSRSCIRTGPRQPNITLPYSSVLTAIAYTN
jgi:hypothetical protein